MTDKRTPEEVNRSIEATGGWKAINESLEKHRKNIDFLQAHYEEWIKKYPEKWVAVHEEELVGVADELASLASIITKEKMPRGSVVIEFLTTKNVPLIFECQVRKRNDNVPLFLFYYSNFTTSYHLGSFLFTPLDPESFVFQVGNERSVSLELNKNLVLQGGDLTGLTLSLPKW